MTIGSEIKDFMTHGHQFSLTAPHPPHLPSLMEQWESRLTWTDAVCKEGMCQLKNLELKIPTLQGLHYQTCSTFVLEHDHLFFLFYPRQVTDLLSAVERPLSLLNKHLENIWNGSCHKMSPGALLLNISLQE